MAVFYVSVNIVSRKRNDRTDVSKIPRQCQLCSQHCLRSIFNYLLTTNIASAILQAREPIISSLVMCQAKHELAHEFPSDPKMHQQSLSQIVFKGGRRLLGSKIEFQRHFIFAARSEMSLEKTEFQDLSSYVKTFPSILTFLKKLSAC